MFQVIHFVKAWTQLHWKCHFQLLNEFRPVELHADHEAGHYWMVVLVIAVRWKTFHEFYDAYSNSHARERPFHM